MCQFYCETIGPGRTDYTNLELEGFTCIQAFFVLINSRAGRLKTLNDNNNSSAAAGSGGVKGILKNSSGGGDKITSISSNEGAKKQNLNFASQTEQIDTTGTKTNDAAVETGNSAILNGASPAIGPKPPTSTQTSISDNQGRVNLMMNAPPSEMEGMAVLWSIAKQVENTNVSAAVV